MALIIELCFYFTGFMSCFQTKFCRIFGRFFGVRIFWISWCHLGLNILFSNEFWDRCMPCGFLRGVSGNRSSFMNMWRLPRVRPSGRCVTILLVLELTIFNVFLPYYMSLVDIGCYSYKFASYYVNSILNNYLFLL